MAPRCQMAVGHPLKLTSAYKNAGLGGLEQSGRVVSFTLSSTFLAPPESLTRIAGGLEGAVESSQKPDVRKR